MHVERNTKIKIHQLHTLISIEQAGSITAAADMLHVSVPAVIKSIKNLEEEFGVALIDRSGYRASLNPYGKYLTLHAHGIVHAMDEAKRGLKNMINKQQKQLLVAVAPSLLSEIVPKTIHQIRKFIPDAIVHFGTYAMGLPDNNVPNLLNGEHDVLLSPVLPGTDLTGIHYEPLMRMTLRIIASSKHPALKLTNPSLSQLTEYDWIIPSLSGEPFSLVSQMFIDHGAALPKSVLAMPVRHIALNMLKYSEFLAVMACNDELFDLDDEDVEIIDIDCSGYGWTNFILQREAGPKSDLQNIFIRELKALVTPQSSEAKHH